MKKYLIIAVVALLTISAYGQDGKSIYKKYSDAQGVSAVYISPAMFRLMGKIPEIEVGDGMDIAPLIKSLNGFYLIDSENKSINSDIKKDVDRMLNRGVYELLMEVKDNGDIIHIYTVGDKKTITSFLFFADEPEETTFISIDGQMPREELEKLIAETMD